MSDNLLTRAQVAQLLNISLRSVDRLRVRGVLSAVKVGTLTSVRFKSEEVKTLMDPRRGTTTF